MTTKKEKTAPPPAPTKAAKSMLERLDKLRPKPRPFSDAHREKVQLHRLQVGARQAKRGGVFVVRGKKLNPLEAAISANATELEMSAEDYREEFAAVLARL